MGGGYRFELTANVNVTKTTFSGALPQTPLGELKVLPQALSLLPLPKNPTPALSPSGLRIQPLFHRAAWLGPNY